LWANAVIPAKATIQKTWKTVEPISKSLLPEKVVMPVETGIQKSLEILDSRLRGNDRGNPSMKEDAILR
jgi:hypothetical protein